MPRLGMGVAVWLANENTELSSCEKQKQLFYEKEPCPFKSLQSSGMGEKGGEQKKSAQNETTNSLLPVGVCGVPSFRFVVRSVPAPGGQSAAR